MSAKEKVYRSPIVVLAEFMGNIQLEGFANYSDDPRHDPWGLLDFGNRHEMKILCTFKVYGAPVLDTGMILVDSPGPCSDPSYTAGWQVYGSLVVQFRRSLRTSLRRSLRRPPSFRTSGRQTFAPTDLEGWKIPIPL